MEIHGDAQYLTIPINQERIRILSREISEVIHDDCELNVLEKKCEPKTVINGGSGYLSDGSAS